MSRAFLWLLAAIVALSLLFQTIFGSAPYKDAAVITPSCVNWREVREFNLINQARVNHGLHKYGWWTCYQIRWARNHSRDMAAKGYLYHQISPLPSYWRAWGQNVGEGPTVDAIHRAFMASAPHRDNILDRDFRRVAVGIVKVNGTVWITEDFIDP